MAANMLLALAKRGYLLVSGLMAVLGLILLLNPYVSMENLCMMGGWTLILFGAVKLIGYCSKDLYRLAFEHDLAAGMTVMTLGLFILLHAENLMGLVILLLGIVVMTDAYTKIQIALDSREFGIQHWRWILVTALVTGVLGFLLVFRSSVGRPITVRMMGIALIAEAIQNCTTILIAVKIIHRNQDREREEWNFRKW